MLVRMAARVDGITFALGVLGWLVVEAEQEVLVPVVAWLFDLLVV